MVDYLEVGKIVNTFGIRGQVKVMPFTDDVRRFEKLKEVFIEKKKELLPYKIENVKYTNNMVILKIEGIDSIEEAEKFKNCSLQIDRKHAKKLPKDTYFIADLIGLEVFTDEGTLLGTVDDIYNSGSSDIYVVKDELGKQVLIPAIKDVLKNVDLESGKITVHIIKGLLD